MNMRRIHLKTQQFHLKHQNVYKIWVSEVRDSPLTGRFHKSYNDYIDVFPSKWRCHISTLTTRKSPAPLVRDNDSGVRVYK